MSEILVKEYRGNIVENTHRGSIAVVSSTGDTIAYLGDIEKQTFMRSASKPIQVLPTLLAGLHISFSAVGKAHRQVKAPPKAGTEQTSALLLGKTFQPYVAPERAHR